MSETAEPKPILWEVLSGKIGVVLIAAVTFALLITPVSTQQTVTSDGVETTRSLSLIQSEGWGIAVVLAVPVLIALVAAFSRGIIATAAFSILTVLTLLALPSIGLFYLPGVLALGIAFFLRGRRSRAAAEDAV